MISDEISDGIEVRDYRARFINRFFLLNIYIQDSELIFVRVCRCTVVLYVTRTLIIYVMRFN